MGRSDRKDPSIRCHRQTRVIRGEEVRVAAPDFRCWDCPPCVQEEDAIIALGGLPPLVHQIREKLTDRAIADLIEIRKVRVDATGFNQSAAIGLFNARIEELAQELCPDRWGCVLVEIEKDHSRLALTIALRCVRDTLASTIHTSITIHDEEIAYRVR